jgi:hypothetical protein
VVLYGPNTLTLPVSHASDQQIASDWQPLRQHYDTVLHAHFCNEKPALRSRLNSDIISAEIGDFAAHHCFGTAKGAVMLIGPLYCHQ